jgi:4-nitrophenyl phosphatase
VNRRALSVPSGLKALILDMDGVLWRADQAIGDLPEIFRQIKARHLKVLLATNNSTRSVDQYVQKLAGFGVQIEAWQVINSSQATAHYLKERYPQGGAVYVVGEEGLFQALSEKGFRQDRQGAQAVVVGMDRQITYDKLKRATLLVRSGIPLIATNPDRTFPTPEGLVPGAGSIIAALEAATDVEAFVVGKPSQEMFKVALERLQATAAETLAVGDRLETDIAGAQAVGCKTALVLSGVTTESAARTWQPAPDFIFSDLTELVSALHE